MAPRNLVPGRGSVLIWELLVVEGRVLVDGGVSSGVSRRRVGGNGRCALQSVPGTSQRGVWIVSFLSGLPTFDILIPLRKQPQSKEKGLA